MASILESIQKIIIDNIRNDKAVFVFPTDISCFSWAEWAVKNTGVRAVPKERFKAWDRFKAETENDDKEGHPVPGLLRKIFVENLMSRNKKERIFKKIISPEYADNSESFTDWVCSVLPSLKSWNELYTNKYGNKVLDEEDADYKLLYESYSDFLLKDPFTGLTRDEKLYEPAWETKKLFTDDKEYYVFFPEILDDYADYKEFFTSGKNPHIHVIFAKDSDDYDKEICAEYFTNTRTEFRKLCLELRNLHENEKVSWRDMAVSVPDIDTYLPYLERDLKLYCIPYIVRSGRKVTGINAGSVFTCVLDVASKDFSYDSMRTLLTNSFVPWIRPELNDELVREGANHKCIINFEKNEKKVDVWKESLDYAENKLLSSFYSSIKKWILDMTSATSFAEVRKAWFIHRSKLFDFDSLPEDSECNLVLGHCFDKLDELIKIEEKYGLKVSDPFTFFVHELDNAVYQPQVKHTGVSVFKYKVSATAAFPYQFVVDSNQNNLSVLNAQLKFLNNEKRSALKILDEDTATESFILLYAKNYCKFTSSQSTVTGFAIPHSRFTCGNDPEDFISPELLSFDYPKVEEDFIKGKGDKPCKVYESQTGNESGFDYYKTVNVFSGIDNEETVCPAMKDKVRNKSLKDNLVKVNATEMGSYFPCTRKWLFSYVLNMNEDSLTTEFFNPFDTGNIYHRVLEKYFGWYKENKKPIPIVNDKGELPDEDNIKKVISGYLKEALEETDSRKALSFQKWNTKSSLIKEAVFSQAEKMAEFFIPVLQSLCSPYDEEHSKKSGFGNGYVIASEESLNDTKNEVCSLYGELDCVFCNDEKLSIIDYKTNKVKSAEECIVDKSKYNPDSAVLPDLKDFQIPMYVHLLLNSNLIKAGDLEQALFFSLKKAEKSYIVKEPQMKKGGKEKYKNDKTATLEEYEATLDAFKRYAEIFASEIRSCKSFKPDFTKVLDYEHCTACSYNSICRTTYTKK